MSMTDYASTAAKKLSAIFFGLISAALLARYLGPEGRGSYAIIVSFAAIIISVMNFGVSNYYAYERRALSASIARSYMMFFFTVFLVIISSGALWWSASEQTSLYAVGAILAAFSLLRMQTQSVLLVEHVRGATVAAILGAACEALILLLCYLLFDRYVLLAVGALVVKELVIVVASILHLRRYPGDRRSIWPVGAQLLTGGKAKGVIAAFVLTALITINYKIDALVMAMLGLPAVQIGVYALGVAMAEYLWIFSDIFKDVQVSRTARGGVADGVARDLRMAIAMTLMAYAAFLSVGWFLVEIVFGDGFGKSYFVTLAMLGATIFIVPCKLIGVYFISIGRFRPYITIMGLAVLVNVCLNLLLIPVLGIYGAVIASIVSYGLAGVWILVDFAALTSVPIHRALVLRRTDVTSVIESVRNRLSARRRTK